MKVAKIAAAPTLRMIGMRLPNSAQAKPPIESSTIAIKISDGTVPVAANPPITPMRMTKTGNGMMPILKSTIAHQPFGQNPSAPLGSACATLPISCATGCPPRFYSSCGNSNACRRREILTSSAPAIAGEGDRPKGGGGRAGLDATPAHQGELGADDNCLSTTTKRRVKRPLHHVRSLRELQWSPSPLRGGGK